MTGTKSIALFDLDKTIYNYYSFFGFIQSLVKDGTTKKEVLEKILSETKDYELNKQSYMQAALKAIEIFGESLVGIKYEDIQQNADKFFQENMTNFYPYFAQILPTLKKTHKVYLVTTNFQAVAEAVKKIFDLDGYLSTQYEVLDGKFTGKVKSTLANSKSIAESLISQDDQYSLAVGDSENDISMLEIVKIPICINPSPELLKVATEKNWLVISDSTAKDQILQILAGISC